MSLKEFGTEIREIRLQKKISLSDISTETRINVKYLEAIERGEFQILPQTYVRAFIREYALVLNIDHNDLLKRYDSAKQENALKKTAEQAVQPPALKDNFFSESFTNKFLALSPLQRNIVFGIFIVLFIALILFLAILNTGTDSGKPVTETSFDNVIRESEATSAVQRPAALDSTRILMQKKDSLRLEISTNDSVWLSLLIDGKKGEEYLFAANKKRAWTAKEQFVITMGNAGGATFRLNGRDIGSLGKPGAVIRNTIISEANLKN